MESTTSSALMLPPGSGNPAWPPAGLLGLMTLTFWMGIQRQRQPRKIERTRPRPVFGRSFRGCCWHSSWRRTNRIFLTGFVLVFRM